MTNFEHNEKQKFASLASKWWDPSGLCQPLHKINPLRVSFISEHIELRNKTILDVGCGGGILAESLAEKGAILTGIDINPNIIKTAKDHANRSGLQIDYQQTTIDALSKSNSFDVITCMELLEHVSNPQTIVASCKRLLKPNGHIFFSTINRNAKAHLQAIIFAEYILKLLPKEMHDYKKFIKPSELDRWARQSNLALKDLRGFKYNILSDAYSFSSNVDVNYLAYYQG